MLLDQRIGALLVVIAGVVQIKGRWVASTSMDSINLLLLQKVMVA